MWTSLGLQNNRQTDDWPTGAKQYAPFFKGGIKIMFNLYMYQKFDLYTKCLLKINYLYCLIGDF